MAAMRRAPHEKESRPWAAPAGQARLLAAIEAARALAALYEQWRKRLDAQGLSTCS